MASKKSKRTRDNDQQNNKEKKSKRTRGDNITNQPEEKEIRIAIPSYLADLNLTEKQYLFCKYYIALDNGKQAAIKAGYSEVSAAVSASNMIELEKIQDALARIRNETITKYNEKHKQSEITSDNILAVLGGIALLDPLDIHEKEEGVRVVSKMIWNEETQSHEERLYEEKIHNPILPIHEWPLEARRALKKLSVDPKTGRIVKVELYDRIDATRLLGAWLNDMFGRGKGEDETDLQDKANKLKSMIKAISDSVPTPGIRLVKK